MALQDVSCGASIEICACAVGPLILYAEREAVCNGELSQLAVGCVLKIGLQHRALQYMSCEGFTTHYQSVQQ